MREILVVLALVLAACGSSEPVSSAGPVEDIPATTVAVTATTLPASTTTTTVPEATTTSVPGTLIEIGFFAGAVTGGGRVEVPLGETVTLAVTSDVTEEVHVHGYDLKLDLAPTVTGELVFVADIPGVFEVELEKARLAVLDLEVGG